MQSVFVRKKKYFTEIKRGSTNFLRSCKTYTMFLGIYLFFFLNSYITIYIIQLSNLENYSFCSFSTLELLQVADLRRDFKYKY